MFAFTSKSVISSLDYQRELAELNSGMSCSSSPVLTPATLTELPSPTTPTATIKALRSAFPSPDPDETDATLWEEPEPWTAIITRREHPREVSSLLSIRDVLRNKPSSDASSLGSRFSGSISRGITTLTPPSAWALPQVQVNLKAADGHVSQFPETVERVLESVQHQSETTSSSDYTFSTADMITPTPSGFVGRHIRTRNASSIISFEHVETQQHEQAATPAIPPINFSSITHAAHTDGPSAENTTPSNSSFSGVLSSAMRYFLSTGSPSRPSSPAPPAGHHGLAALEMPTPIDDRPHIKYDWTIGKRLKFSCTVYYAKQFDVLRKRCGVDDVIVKSLARSENWAAVGGKSKSNFYKSSDDRFIIKTLVNAWNVADL